MVKLKLSELLVNPKSIDWRYALYLPKDKELWGVNVLALVMDPDEIDSDDPDEEPAEVQNMGYMYILAMQDVTSIIENSREQKSNISLDDIFDALIFYYKNDAFIKFN